MSFFKEFKEDLSQAVNELVAEDEALKNQGSEPELQPESEDAEEDQMVNTLDIAIEEVGEVQEAGEEPALFQETEKETGDSPEAVAFSKSEETYKTEETPFSVSLAEGKESSDEKAEVTKGTFIEGNISSEGSINLEGKVKGNVSCLGKLIASGEIIGASKAAEVYTNNSRIVGDVISEGSIKIGNGSVIIGNVYATSAVIGGAIKGDIDVKGPVILDSSAVVQGNIKSRSVQINNGAVIDGLVSQCYADVDYKALFDDTFSK